MFKITVSKDKETQGSLEQEIEDFLKERGALRVGFATLETMSGGPEGANLKYMLPEAESAIGFALPLNKELIRPFLGKKYINARGDHEIDNIEVNRRATEMSRDLADLLIKKGYKAVGLVANNKYREDVTGWRGSLPPELSIRYLAVRSGVASFGWSGNVGIKGIGATIILGATITSARLKATEPIPEEDSFCNKCKLCVKVCANRMFSEDEETTITLGGKTFSYSKRLDKFRCLITCGGCDGLDKTGTWSTWSPGRYEYPENSSEVQRLLRSSMVSLLKRPRIKDSSKGYVASALSGTYDDDSNFDVENNDTIQLTCGNCQIICWGDPKETAENYKLLTNSGCVLQKEDGELYVLPPQKAKEEFEKIDARRKKLYTKEYKRRARKK